MADKLEIETVCIPVVYDVGVLIETVCIPIVNDVQVFIGKTQKS